MKVSVKSITITTVLVLILFIVLFVESSLFISGPQRSYEERLRKERYKINETCYNITNLKRHVFHYTTYVGETYVSYIWFNEEGKDIALRMKDTRNDEKVIAHVKKQYHATNISVELGYGYQRPVYVVECNLGTILLDYDSLEEVYYFRKGEVL